MKRFTETDKWKDTWFRKLKPSEKLLWLYMVDNCNNAGIFEFDIEFCSFITGMTEQQLEGAIKGLNRGCIESKSGNTFFVKNFLRHQKNNVLNPENNAHKQIIRLLEENQPLFDDKSGAIKGLLSPIGKGKGKVGVKVRVKVEYSVEFESWWKSCGKGAKVEAFKAWNNQADKPSTPELIDIHSKYKDHCIEEERTLRDSQGWINGRLWETSWESDTKPKATGPSLEEMGLV